MPPQLVQCNAYHNWFNATQCSDVVDESCWLAEASQVLDLLFSLQVQDAAIVSPSRAAQSAGLLSRTGAQSPAQLQHQLQQQQLQQQLEEQAEAEEQAAAASLRDSPEEAINARPVHVHVIGHTSLPSQLQRQRQQQQHQQQQQAHGLMPRVAHYQQSPNAMLGYQHYQSELAQPPHQSPQQQGLALGIHQYQQHADGLMHFQHQPTLSAIQQQQQQMHGVGELVGPGMGLQLQERGQFYGGSEHGAAASQPAMPVNYAQVRNYVQKTSV